MENREHKYQAWHKTHKKMYRVVTLYLGAKEQSVTLIDKDSPFLTCSMDEIELREFTGLKDKTGKDIYEGDIVGTPDDPDYSGSVRFGNVEFDYNGYIVQMNGFYVATLLKNMHFFVTEEMNTGKVSILGNIYEHPHLTQVRGVKIDHDR